ncbi:major head protein [Gordonia phage Yvonnetastic]|uniref:Major capsid protein n=1 Tax=Gordonia phage Yvonnetastic TaxID=1821566 RepID=A0A142K8Z4_9CAUD|nr:major head protein [Gordonia phage Yvonnetastic]AMS02577.1 major capsid protein [Gordonia phage Yvonnetastic]
MANENILMDPVHPDAAIAFAREVPDQAQNVLNQYLPDKTIQDTRVEVTEVEMTSHVAEYRSFDGSIPRLKRDGYRVSQVSLQPLSQRGGYGEYERLQLEKLRQNGGSEAALADAIYNDIERSVKYIRNRVEIARGQLLSTGQQVINENGVNLSADYGVPDEHFVSPEVEWTDVDDAKPIEDLLKWVEVYADSYGAVPAGMLMSRKTKGLLRASAEIRNFANMNVVGGPRFVNDAVVASALDNFDLPGILPTYDQKIAGNRVIPEGKIIFLPPNPADLGNTYWGITATAMELLNAAQTDLSFADAPGLVGIVTKTGPPFLQEVIVDSLVLPVLNNPKALFVADISVGTAS